MGCNSCNAYHEDLKLVNELAYMPSGIKLEAVQSEDESREYGATTFTVMNKKIKFRVAKLTPTKVGHFVAIWKREDGVTKPHDEHDPYHFFIISVRDKMGFGQFIFNKSTLIENKIISTEFIKGKRGMRLYPPWVKTPNKQSKKSQEWQCKHFIMIDMLHCNIYPRIIEEIKNN